MYLNGIADPVAIAIAIIWISYELKNLYKIIKWPILLAW